MGFHFVHIIKVNIIITLILVWTWCITATAWMGPTPATSSICSAGWQGPTK